MIKVNASDEEFDRDAEKVIGPVHVGFRRQAKREMPVELMSNQLMASERLPKSRQISGLIFHCTPLVDLALAAVNLSRKWIAEHRNEVV